MTDHTVASARPLILAVGVVFGALAVWERNWASAAFYLLFTTFFALEPTPAEPTRGGRRLIWIRWALAGAILLLGLGRVAVKFKHGSI
jgi:hypothetical protein